MYRDGRYHEALVFYTDALSMAKSKPQKIALHSNRAACYLKLHDFKKSAEECTSVLELDHKHTGALMLRAQTLVTLKEYHAALFDVSRLIELNPSSEVYKNLEARLRTQVALCPIPESEAELEEEEEEEGQAGKYRIGKETEKDDRKEGPMVSVKGGQTAEIKQVLVTAETAKDDREEGFLVSVKGDQKAEVNQVLIIAEDVKGDRKEISEVSVKEDQEAEVKQVLITSEAVVPKTSGVKECSEPGKDQRAEPKRTPSGVNSQEKNNNGPSEKNSAGWQAIPKPKGHSALDYARWDRVEDDSSEDDDDDDNDEESQPQYRFRVRTVGMRSVK